MKDPTELFYQILGQYQTKRAAGEDFAFHVELKDYDTAARLRLAYYRFRNAQRKEALTLPADDPDYGHCAFDKIMVRMNPGKSRAAPCVLTFTTDDLREGEFKILENYSPNPSDKPEPKKLF